MRPEGALKAAAQSAGRTLTRQADPYLRLLELLRTPGSPQLNYASEVAPWIGSQAAAFAGSLEGSSTLLAPLEQMLLGGASSGAFPFSARGVQGAIVLSTSDQGKARSFLESRRRRAGAHAASYRGVALQTTSAGIAFGVVDGSP